MSSRKEQLNDTRGVARARARNSDVVSEQPSPSVNMDELKELIGLLRANGLAELELERQGFRVRLRREGTSPVVQPETFAPVAEPVQAAKAAPVSTPAAPPLHPGARAETAPRRAAPSARAHRTPRRERGERRGPRESMISGPGTCRPRSR